MRRVTVDAYCKYREEWRVLVSESTPDGWSEENEKELSTDSLAEFLGVEALPEFETKIID